MANFRKFLTQYLIEGYTQPEISEIFKENNINPNSLSSIEKEIKRLKEFHKAKTMCHLGAILAIKKYIKPKSTVKTSEDNGN